MEDYFLYSSSNLGVESCKAFMNDLAAGSREDAQLNSDQREVYISPQNILQSTQDPFKYIPSSVDQNSSVPNSTVKQEEGPEENFDRIFDLPADAWDNTFFQSPAAPQSALPQAPVSFSQKESEHSRQQIYQNQNGYISPPYEQNTRLSPGNYNQQNEVMSHSSDTHTTPSSNDASPVTHSIKPDPDGDSSRETTADRSHQSSPGGNSQSYQDFGPVGLNSMASGGVSGGNISKSTASLKASRRPKTAHNMIEKRYRNNINDKINQLRDCVPSLRDAAESSSSSDSLANVRLNKATVLSTAAQYILQLEQRNQALECELRELKMGRSAAAKPVARVPTEMPSSNIASDLSSGSAANLMERNDLMFYQEPQQQYQQQQQQHYRQYQQIQSSIPLPQHPRRTVNQQSPQQYQQSYPAYPANRQPPSQSRFNAKMLAVGGTAALAVMNGIQDNDIRGLAAIPLPLPGLGGSATVGGVLKAFCLLTVGVIAIDWILQFFMPPPPDKDNVFPAKTAQQQQRVAAHETAIRKLNFPASDSVVGHCMAFLQLLPQLALHFLFHSDQQIPNHLKHRHAFLRQAADSHLLGGDRGRSGYFRLRSALITIHGTMNPVSSRRYMIQALQIIVTCDGTIFEGLGFYIANRFWTKAQRILYKQQLQNQESNLPINLQNLLKLDFKSVILIPRHRQYLSMLRMSESTSDPSFYLSAHDPNVHTALDVLASLVSHSIQNAVLRESLLGKQDSNSLEIAIQICPPRSNMLSRANLLAAVLTNSEDSLTTVMKEIQTMQSLNVPIASESVQVLQCAMALYHIKAKSTAAGDSKSESLKFGESLAAALDASKCSGSEDMLPAIQLYTLKQLNREEGLPKTANLGEIAVSLRHWLSNNATKAFGFKKSEVLRLVRDDISLLTAFNPCLVE